MRSALSHAGALLLLLFLTSSALIAHSLFSVGNRSSQTLGPVTLGYTSGFTTIEVSGSGTYTTEVAGNINSISIAGTTSYRPTDGTATLPTGAKVIIHWSNSSLVEVFDWAELD